jgi:hypothetical protein
MKKFFGALALVALVSSGAYAITADVAPTHGTPNYSDGSFPALFEIPLDFDDYCVGVGFDGTYLWVSAGNQGTGQCSFYIINPDDGSLVDTQVQGGGATSWGHRDLCWDGSYMFGSYNQNIDGFADPATFSGFFVGPINPNRALAFDGTYFYTGGFGQYLYQLTWDGSFGSVAGAVILDGPIDGTYGLAYDCILGHLWMTTADYSGNIFEYGLDGFLWNVYTTLPEYDIQGGCTMANSLFGFVLVVLQQYSPDTLTYYDLGHTTPSPVNEGTWGSIKSLFQ